MRCQRQMLRIKKEKQDEEEGTQSQINFGTVSIPLCLNVIVTENPQRKEIPCGGQMPYGHHLAEWPLISQ